MLQTRGNNGFKCFRNCRLFGGSSIVLKFTFAPFLWSGIIQESFQTVGKTGDEIDK